MRPAERLGLRDQFGVKKIHTCTELGFNSSSDVYLPRSFLKRTGFLSLLSLFCLLIFNLRALAVGLLIIYT